MISLPWYKKLEDAIAPSWPLMTVLAIGVIAVTAALLYYRKPVPLAAWLVYVLSP